MHELSWFSGKYLPGNLADNCHFAKQYQRNLQLYFSVSHISAWSQAQGLSSGRKLLRKSRFTGIQPMPIVSKFSVHLQPRKGTDLIRHNKHKIK